MSRARNSLKPERCGGKRFYFSQAAIRRRLHILKTWYAINRSEFLGPSDTIWESPILVHIPKTAGISAIKAGAQSVFGHKPYRYYEKWCPPGRRLPIVFAIVRHPFDRFVSAYRYLKFGSTPYDRRWADRFIYPTSDVSDFVFRMLGDNIRMTRVLKWMHFRPQIDFLVDKSGKIGVDRILQYENLATCWPEFALKANLNPRLQWYNKTPETTAINRLNPKAQRIVARVYYRDFEFLGYAPPDL